MGKYFSLGHFNKKYFFILGSITVRFIITFITGFTPYLTPNKTIFILGFKSNIFSHPMITYCFQYFSLCLGGFIIEFVLKRKNKEDETPENNDLSDIPVKKMSESSISTKYIFNDLEKTNHKRYYPRIFVVFSLYYFAKIGMTSLDNLGYNRVKYWPLEFIPLYFFRKKILNKEMYKHQILSLSSLLFICTTIYVINSFISQSNSDCTSLSGEKLENCELLSVNIYNDISKKLGGYFIPIIILVYLAAMGSNAYSSIISKWFMDIKYITLNRMIIYIGIIGFFYSFILLIIISNISCPKDNDVISYICKLDYNGELFYDNFKTLGSIEYNSDFYIDIFVLVPIYVVCSFLIIFIELLMIRDLDPFYLIPIDCLYFLLYDVIDYCITYSITTVNRNYKFACQFSSNAIAIFLCSIYLEIIELHFCSLDIHLKRYIIERVEKEKLVVLKDLNEVFDSESIGSTETH